MSPSNHNNHLTPHNQAINRYYFTGKIKLLQALHIGSGYGDGDTDALVIRDASGKPLIPGSSLRGAFRCHLERLLMGLYVENATTLWACQLYEAILPAGKKCYGNSVFLSAARQAKQIPDELTWDELDQGLCDACKLFGAGTYYASKIRFTDLKMLSGNAKPTIRHGVGIHRDTGTAADGVKYDKEVVESGAEFQFEVIGENLGKNDLMLLALGFSQLMRGEIVLGGSTGRGLGGIQLVGGGVQWVNLSQTSEARKYLLEKTYQHTQAWDLFVNDYIKKLLPA